MSNVFSKYSNLIKPIRIDNHFFCLFIKQVVDLKNENIHICIDLANWFFVTIEQFLTNTSRKKKFRFFFFQMRKKKLLYFHLMFDTRVCYCVSYKKKKECISSPKKFHNELSKKKNTTKGQKNFFSHLSENDSFRFLPTFIVRWKWAHY